ncbi:MAG: NADH-quinone oxidoreductase subunit K [Candidatus Heimdallarchaeota archaeon]
MDWSTFFPYSLICVIILLAIGIYALITCKTFLRAVFGIELLLMAVNLLLLSFGLGGETSPTPDPFAQTISILIIVIGVVLLVVGTTIDKFLRKNHDSTELEFNFFADGVNITKDEEGSQSINETVTSKAGEK